MTLRRHASPRAPSKRGKGQRSTTAVPFLFTPPAPSVQGRARAHDIAPFHFTPPAPAKWGRAAFNACRAVRLYHACAIHAGKGVFTWHCSISPCPAHSVRAWKGWKRCQQIRGCSRAHCPSRKERAHMTLCRHASPCAPSKRGKGQRSTTAVPFLFTPPAPSVQGRARAHDIAPFHFTPPAPAKWGRAAFTACRAVRLYHVCVICAGKGALT